MYTEAVQVTKLGSQQGKDSNVKQTADVIPGIFFPVDNVCASLFTWFFFSVRVHVPENSLITCHENIVNSHGTIQKCKLNKTLPPVLGFKLETGLI